MWYLGIFLVVGSSLSSVVALGMADQATLSIGSAFTLIFNSVLAWKFLKEDLPCFKVYTILMISVGAWVVVYSASYESRQYSSKELMDLMFRSESALFLSLLFLGCIVTTLMSMSIISVVEKEMKAN